MPPRFRSGGLAAWSIKRPVAVLMLSLTVVILGLFSLKRLAIDLLPHVIYPEIRVRITDPGVPARIMEDQVTRQLEEQLSITEGAIAIQSSSAEGRSNVDLSFPYGTDIDAALRDASTRLDRAKRFLPTTIEPPVIYKRDPSQIPVMELAVSSSQLESEQLRDWVDYQLSNWFINLPGVASTEVGGGRRREIQVVVDQDRLASLGISFDDIRNTLNDENRDYPGGRVFYGEREFNTRTAGRILDPLQLGNLPVLANRSTTQNVVRIRDVARIVDTHEDERLRVRLNGVPAIKLSIQKQPNANTVDVVDAVTARLAWLQSQKIIPPGVHIATTADQSIYIRHSLRNASTAVISGALLAMLVVYLFLGDLTRTLVIGLAIPLAILVTLIIMALSGLTLNIMTLGGLALGVGMLVDNAIVMLENISRHQQSGEEKQTAAINAAAEVNGAIVASTSTNLAAILPFLFIGGRIGLLFSELIITLSAAVMASLVVALTIVPALGSRPRVANAAPSLTSRWVNRLFGRLQHYYRALLEKITRHPMVPLLVLLPLVAAAFYYFANSRQDFMPKMDEGSISVSIVADSGVQLEQMDRAVKKLETLFLAQKEVKTALTTVGGFIFGRSEFQSSQRSSINIQLIPSDQRNVNSQQWIRRMSAKINKLELVGFQVRMRVRGIRGLRTGRGDDDLSLRIQGDDINVLKKLGDQVVDRLRGIDGLRNLTHSYENLKEEVVIEINRERALDLDIQPGQIGRALQVSLDGLIVSDFIDGDRQYNVRLRLPREQARNRTNLENLLVGYRDAQPIRLRDVAKITIDTNPEGIYRDNQRRMVEISGSLGEKNLGDLLPEIDKKLASLQLPDGYSLYDGGQRAQLQEGQQIGTVLLGLAIFLVFVVMAIQYESLRNPFIILLSIPFAIIGVASGIYFSLDTITAPVWLGMIMLAGIVVNNAIVMVERIEIEKELGRGIIAAVNNAAQLRLRPILMTTLTTVVGMLPLAIGLGEGSEMLQPLAIVIVWGLLFSTLSTLVVVPSLYVLFHRRTE